MFHDPGHGWVRVSIAELCKLGIVDGISSYSYRRGGWAFLEEDCDAATWYHAYTKVNGRKPELDHRHINTNSNIRDFTPYQ